MIDSGGLDGTTDTVYSYCKDRELQRVFCLKGSSQQKAPIYTRPKRRNAQGVWLFQVGTFEAKKLIYNRLKQKEVGPGYIHFPVNEWAGFDVAAYESLTSERIVTKYHHGHPKQYWIKSKEARNEVLDLSVYSLVAIRHINPDWQALRRMYELKKIERATAKEIEPPTSATHPNKSESLSKNFGVYNKVNNKGFVVSNKKGGINLDPFKNIH